MRNVSILIKIFLLNYIIRLKFLCYIIQSYIMPIFFSYFFKTIFCYSDQLLNYLQLSYQENYTYLYIKRP